MPYAENNGIKIFYEVEGSGSPVVLAHGLSMSSEDWRELGYVDGLINDYKLILVDARGHGRSDKPHDPAAYRQINRAMDHIAVLDDLGLAKAHFLGYSMGGNSCLGVGIHAPQRCLSLMLGGTQPFESDELSEEIVPHTPKALRGLPDGDDPVRDILVRGGEYWVDFFKANMEVTPGLEVRLNKNDLEALIAFRDSSDEKGLSSYLEQLDIQCLVFVGEDEYVYRGAVEMARRLPHAEFVSFPGFNHFEIIANVDVILPAIMDFLRRHG